MKLIGKIIAMEQHSLKHSFSKRIWRLIRLVLRSISRCSTPILKRVKIAAMSNSRRRHKYPFTGPRLAYEFSCSNSPVYPIKKWGRGGHSPPSEKEVEEILGRMLMGGGEKVEASPALPGFGFGRSPAVRQLRITDSPFPINYVGENNHIDEDAEKFIAKFYRELMNQTSPVVLF